MCFNLEDRSRLKSEQELHMNLGLIFFPYRPEGFEVTICRSALNLARSFQAYAPVSPVMSRSMCGNDWKSLAASPVRNMNKCLVTTNVVEFYFGAGILMVTSMISKPV
jgi:hypothetical protein